MYFLLLLNDLPFVLSFHLYFSLDINPLLIVAISSIIILKVGVQVALQHIHLVLNLKVSIAYLELLELTGLKLILHSNAMVLYLEFLQPTQELDQFLTTIFSLTFIQVLLIFVFIPTHPLLLNPSLIRLNHHFRCLKFELYMLLPQEYLLQVISSCAY